MIATGVIVSLIIAVASLFLVVRGWRSHGVPFEKGALMAVAWVVIIAVVAFVASRMGLA